MEGVGVKLPGDLRRVVAIWEWDLVFEDVLEGGVAVFAFEGCGSVEHFVDENTERPPIHCTGMTAAFDYFGSNVLLCSHEGIGAEVGNTGLGVYCRKVAAGGTMPSKNHGRSSAGIRLLGEIEV